MIKVGAKYGKVWVKIEGCLWVDFEKTGDVWGLL